MPASEQVLVNEASPTMTTEGESYVPVVPDTKLRNEPKPSWVTGLEKGSGLTRPKSKFSGTQQSRQAAKTNNGQSSNGQSNNAQTSNGQATSQPSTQQPPASESPIPASEPIVAPVPTEQPTPVQTPAHLQSTEPVVTSESVVVTPRILAPESDDDLIQIPGEKPKTVRQYKAEQAQLKDLDRKRGEIGFRERQLQENAQRLSEQIAAIDRRMAQPAPVAATAPATPIIQDGPPPRPQGVIEGDPEWVDWQGRTTAYYVGLQNAKDLAPIRERLDRQEQQSQATERAAAEAQARFARNDEVYTDALRQHLPFDPAGLSQEAFGQVLEQINAVASQAGIGLDNATMQQKDLSPEVAALLVRAAFPDGSLPPGYSRQATQAPHVAPVTVHPVSTLKPLVPQAPTQPLHAPSVPMAPTTLPNQPRSQKGKEGHWMRSLSGETPLQPIGISHSRG